jgi:hypothetical protein
MECRAKIEWARSRGVSGTARLIVKRRRPVGFASGHLAAKRQSLRLGFGGIAHRWGGNRDWPNRLAMAAH